MVEKCSSVSKMTLYFWALSEMTTVWYEASFLWFANAWGQGTAELTMYQMAREGMFADETDSCIIKTTSRK